MLAATADVVMLVDTSDSMNQTILDWTGDLVDSLEAKLVSDGIGSEVNVPNRYKVVNFGSNNDGTVEDVISLHQTNTGWLLPQVATSTIESLTIENGGEDIWEAVEFVLQTEEFRNNAAVHFVVVTDSPGSDDSPYPLGPDARVRKGTFDTTLQELINQSSMGSLSVESGTENHVSDAIVTVIGGAQFSDGQSVFNFVPSGYELVGVDINVQDFWGVDNHTSNTLNNDSRAFVINTQTLDVQALQTDFDFTPNDDYEDMRDDIINNTFRVGTDPNGFPNVVYPSSINHAGMFGDLNAILAWETQGTYWDISHFEGVNTATESSFVAFREMIVDDIFNKVAMQVADFDNDFFAIDEFDEFVDTNPDYLGDAGDIGGWILGRKDHEEGDSSEMMFAKYDLNGNGDVDDADIVLLITKIFRGAMGDTDWNGVVNQADLNDVGGNWQAVNVFDLNMGDTNGDGLVNALDMNNVGMNWLLDLWI